MSNQITGLLSPYLREKRFTIARHHIKGRVLDYGCGSGALAEFVDNDYYWGIDIDQESIEMAKKLHPKHKFYSLYEFENEKNYKFDTIVSLAVIEHLKNPVEYLKKLNTYLNNDGLIVITTPHPRGEFVHGLGAAIGLFSKGANEEHEALIDLDMMKKYCALAKLELLTYKTFLMGFNQLFLLNKSL